jgi:glucose-1-phosphate cytidylyltransferase
LKKKPKGDSNWINGGFFVCEPSVINYIDGSDTVFEQEPLKKIINGR